MKLKFWGCRGSIPVPDSRMIKYGGNTSCIEVELEPDKRLIIDAGTGIRKLGEHLSLKKIYNLDIFITHSHWDHIQGFPFFTPIYDKNFKINLFGCTDSYKKLKTIFEQQMAHEYFPISFSELKSNINFVESCGTQYNIQSSLIKTIRTNHPIYTTGLRIEQNGKTFVFITDNEIYAQEKVTSEKDFISFCKNADYLIHDAQYTDEEYEKRKGWGHSTFEQVLKLSREMDIYKIGFFHHDPNRKDDELDKIVQKFQSENKDIKIFAVKELDEIEL